MAIQIQALHDLFWTSIDSYINMWDIDVIKSDMVREDAFAPHLWEYFDIFNFVTDEGLYPYFDTECCSFVGIRQNSENLCEFIGILPFTYHINFGNENRGILVDNWDYAMDSGNVEKVAFNIIKNLDVTDIFSPFENYVYQDICSNGDFIAIPLHCSMQGDSQTIQGINDMWNTYLKTPIEYLIEAFILAMSGYPISIQSDRLNLIKRITQTSKIFDTFTFKYHNQ